ncbi:MAG: hypothetical protein ACLQVX_20430 [Limisphaerales bacterium]
MNFKILLALPAGERVRVTVENPEVPRRAMLRFSVLPLTVVAALTPRRHEVRVVDENVEPLDFDTECDVVGISFMTALVPRAYEIADDLELLQAAREAGCRRLFIGIETDNDDNLAAMNKQFNRSESCRPAPIGFMRSTIGWTASSGASHARCSPSVACRRCSP